MAKFDFRGARQAGYTDEEIASFLGESNPSFDTQAALKAGYKPEEIHEYLSEQESIAKQPNRAKSLVAAPIKGLLKGGQNINPIPTTFGPISTELGNKLLEKILPTQEKGAEKFLERAGELAPAVALGPEGLIEKGVQTAAAAGLGHLAEKEGLGKGGQFLSEIVGFAFPGLLKSAGSFLRNFIGKEAAKQTGESAAKIANIKPSQVNEAVRESAERLGVLENVPISAQVDNPNIQAIETRLLQSKSGEPTRQKVEKLGEKLADTYEEVGKELSHRKEMLPSAIASEAASTLQNIEEQAENRFRSLYNEASKLLPENATTPVKTGEAIHRIIDSTIKKLRSAIGTPAKDTLVKRLERLKDNWSSSPELRAGNIPVKQLEELKQDLNQIMKYEVKGGVDKLLTPLFAVTKEGIQSYGRKFNQPYLNRFNQAERTFAENAKTFRKDPVLKSLVKGERPEQIFGRMGTSKGIRDLEKVFNRTPEGKETFDALKKYKLEDLLNKKVLDKNGKISWGKAAGMFKEPKTRDLVIQLVGAKQYQKLKDLSKVASGVEEGFKKFLNTSKTATTAMDMLLMVQMPIQMVKQLFTGNVVGAAKSAIGIFGPSQASKLMANPQFVDAAIATAKAGKGNSPSKFLQAAQRVAQFTAAEMLKGTNSPDDNRSLQAESQ